MDKISNLSDLFQIFDNQTPGWIMYFRGQARDWPLKPWIARSTVSEQEREKEPECYKRLASLLPAGTEWERATIAQHYGIPTRLLDWSENPLVGLYFAIEDGNHDNEDGAIWIFEDKTAISKHLPSLLELDYPRPYRASKDLQFNIPRVYSQSGALTSQPSLSKTFDEHDFDKSTQSLRKYMIPKNKKKHLRSQLKILNVSKQKLFPDYLEFDNRRMVDLVGSCMRIRCELFKIG